MVEEFHSANTRCQHRGLRQWRDFLVDVARIVCNAKEVKRVMVIPNSEDGDAYDRLREILRKVDDDDRERKIFMFSDNKMMI